MRVSFKIRPAAGTAPQSRNSLEIPGDSSPGPRWGARRTTFLLCLDMGPAVLVTSPSGVYNSSEHDM
jgi:hypothetical protein